MNRRDFLAGCGLASLSLTSSITQAQANQESITGRAGPGLESIDHAVVEVMGKQRIPGASLSIARNGKLVFARGYGFADVQTKASVRPESLFGLASVSKAITAVTTLALVDQKRVALDDHVFKILNHLQPPRGERVDPRLHAITLRMCLNHSGGWDRKRSGDPNSFEPRVVRALGVRQPVSDQELARFMMGRPLDFNPGTEAHYSNFGFVLLGLIIEHIAGVPYVEAVEKITLRPLGLGRIRMTPAHPGYLPGEVHRYALEPRRSLEGGNFPMMRAAGGWAAPTVEMTRLLTEISGRRGSGFLSAKMLGEMTAAPPPPLVANPKGTGDFGLGWDTVIPSVDGPTYQKGGALSGIHTLIEHRPNGLDWALFVNASVVGNKQGQDNAEPPMWADIQHKVRMSMDAIKAWPDVDYFKEFP